jgi:acyl-CoA synthetase (AMP-forming)/AMP-acid ligase II/predicted MFS family arabinose efflux permease
LPPPRPSESSPSSPPPAASENSGTQATPKSWRRGFWSLIATQFQTAFNDNAVKFLVIYIILAMNLPRERRDFLVPVVGGLFAIPFILFSMAGGNLADRYSKRSVTIGTKLLEIGVMLFAVVTFFLHSLPLECASVFLISSEAALFGPSKYGLLPELLPVRELSWGNGIIELGTFAASIAGTMAAGFLAVRYHGREEIAGFILLGATCLGLLTSSGISLVPAADPKKKFHWNPLGDLVAQSKVIGADRILTWAVLGNAYLFFLAALLQFAIIIFGHDVLRVDDAHVSYLQAAVGIGIGLGSVSAGYLSRGKIEYRLIPVGAVGMTVFSAILYHPGQTMMSSAVHLSLLGFFGGFFVVPIGALIQHRPAPEQKGSVIAAANLYSFVGIFIAAGAYSLFTDGFHQTSAGVFLDGAVLTLVATVCSFFVLPDSLRPLGASLVRGAHRHPFRFAMADMRRPRVKWGAVLLSSIFLARRLKKIWQGQEMVGILLPPSVPGAYVNYAAVLCGKIPVNLNYTASNESLASCAEQCHLETVITTQLLLDKLPVKPPGKTILLEEVAANPSIGERILALMLWPLPGFLLERILSGKRAAKLDDLATIIFSSGSTGDPKGVMLTHFNIASNISQMNQVFMLNRDDTILGVLPFFHAFGFTVSVWLPSVLSVGVAYHPSPIDVGAVATLVRDYSVTILVSTPTFLQHYLRKCAPEDFGSLQLVIVGAEKLPERVALAFEERFGVRPLEGYGCTECSPVVAVNVREQGSRLVGAKLGRIGRPLPGISVSIVDPETRAPLPLDTAGLLLVRGPNVMQGYLGKPEKTADVLQDGWYSTGDIATLDSDGFLTITDRLSRFSKIGGEMVPHIKVEEKLHEIAGLAEMSLVVTGVPDGKKGERLVVLHTLSDADIATVLEKLPQADLPNLWMPRGNQFFYVSELPHLGTGKLDLRRVREIAIEFSGE